LLQFNDYTDVPKILNGTATCRQGSGCPSDISGNFSNWYNKYEAALQTNSAADDQEALEMMGRYQLSYLKDALTGLQPKPENIWKRGYVSLKSIVDETAENTYSQASEVPYEFCPDEFSWESNVACQPYDKGANYREMTADRMQRYDSYYFFSNFKRDRVSFNDNVYLNSYVSRLMSRYFAPMSNVYRYYLYGFQNMGKDKNGATLTLNDFDLGSDWQAAAVDGLNYLTSVLMQPDAGTYCFDAATSVYKASTNGTCPTGVQSLNVPVGVGKYFNTQWTDEYFYKATLIGSFYDKYAALWALTSNEGVFYQNFSDMLDQGAFALSYWRGLKAPMLDLFSSAFTGQAGNLSWRYSKVGNTENFTPVPLVDQYNTPASVASLPKIEPSTSWTLRYYGMILPMARFNSMYDYTEDFSNFVQVCLEGYQDCRAFSGSSSDGNTIQGVEGRDYTAFIDPSTGYRYLAAKTPDQTGALGAQLLDEAQRYVDDVYAPALQNGNAASIAAAERGLYERTSYLDMIRRFANAMQFGG
jgi:hypothetical protein